MMNRIHLHFPFLALRSEVQRPLLLVCLLCSLSHAEAQEEWEDSVALGEGLKKETCSFDIFTSPFTDLKIMAIGQRYNPCGHGWYRCVLAASVFGL